MLLPVTVTNVAGVLFDDLSSAHLGLPIHEDELEPFQDCLKDLDRADASKINRCFKL